MNVKELSALLNEPAAIEKAAKEARYICAVAEIKSREIINALNRDLAYHQYMPAYQRTN